MSYDAAAPFRRQLGPACCMGVVFLVLRRLGLPPAAPRAATRRAATMIFDEEEHWRDG